MKKHVAFKIMLPLIIIFILTISVNMSTTSCMQSAREALGDISFAGGVSAEITSMAEKNSAQITSALASNGVISSLQLIMVVVTIAITYISFVRPLINTEKQLNALIENLEQDKGNLNERIQSKKVDEIGRLIFGINLFLNKLQSIVKSIQGHSISLDDSSGKIVSKVSDSTKDMKVVSGEADELCSEMKRIQETLNGIAADMRTLNESSGEISSSALSGKDYTTEMKKRADEIKELATNSKSESEKIASSLEAVLRNSIENGKSVTSIQSLTDEILSISSQTNLLALNASIEAARAGEAGKGFAVVADEIRALADNSRSTANSIQEISNSVITSVEEMADSSSKLLDFVHTNVLEDYDRFVEASVKYSNDADNLESMMNEFYQKSAELSSISEDVNSGLGRISQAVGDENHKVAELSEIMQELSSNMDEIQDYTAINDEVSNDLKKEIARFKQI